MTGVSFFVSMDAVAVLSVVGRGVSHAAQRVSEFLLRVSHTGHSHVSAFMLAASWKKLVTGAGWALLVVVVVELVAGAEDSADGAAAGVVVVVASAEAVGLLAAPSLLAVVEAAEPSVAAAAGAPKKLNVGKEGCKDKADNILSVSAMELTTQS